MSRTRTRARNRRARLERFRAEFARFRDNPAKLSALLKDLSESDIPVWPIAEAAAGDRLLDDAERAMIAQAVAPHLAGMTPGSVWRRRPSPDPE